MLAPQQMPLTSPSDALVFLLLVTPVALWICYTDLKFMKIRNAALCLLVVIFAVSGLILLPVEVWALRWLHLAVVLVIGFLLSSFAGIGAGDAKYVAVAAPFIPAGHAALALMLLAVFLPAALLMHRALRALPAVRRLAPGWESWHRRDFPMGLAISGALLAYLSLAAFPGLAAAISIRM